MLTFTVIGIVAYYYRGEINVVYKQFINNVYEDKPEQDGQPKSRD